MNREELGGLDLHMTYEGPAAELESTAMTQCSGIVNDPAAMAISGKTQLLNAEARRLRDMGFDIVIVGHSPNREMLKALHDEGFKVVEQGNSLRQGNQPALNHAGPRNKWGGLK